MKTELIQTLTTTFEAHARKVEGGVEYWLARDLQYLLGYSKWDNFVGVVSKAKTACELSGHKVSDHFADVGKTIQMPKGATKEVPDIMLTRYACYLIAQNGDSRKQEIAFAQTGSAENFAVIRSKGDQVLFGKSTQAMKAEWNVPDKRPLADFAPTIILKAKDFATEITIFNAREHGMKSEGGISNEHITNNKAVRNTLLGRGICPESLPPAEDVKKVERRLASEEKQSLKNPDGLSVPTEE
ncbi:DNA damage-inducible protein D [Pelodictyon phaeoclathratiforme]|jgi:DNA-damage-inducible protein D|uniref:DNA-damage-inducible protein D n=1 Tax=Pelodictyon phaeoclathratiforme (strain DSM 5477 / BU-1) TaxID=324925 RepID=B4SF56_PELPB|nr:DNA-damage-inducible protein D [Pelodictyon phaeoclathratiforme BU-1]MBV5290077.1 DNA damage-inducible protein D [Pelodictyon phaeoclathratiforme]